MYLACSMQLQVHTAYDASQLEPLLNGKLHDPQVEAIALTHSVRLTFCEHAATVGLTELTMQQGDMSLEAVLTFVRTILEKHGDDIFRLKASVPVVGNSHRFVIQVTVQNCHLALVSAMTRSIIGLQGVHKRFTYRQHRPWASTERRDAVCVLIGSRLQRWRESWQKDFDAARYAVRCKRQ